VRRTWWFEESSAGREFGTPLEIFQQPAPMSTAEDPKDPKPQVVKVLFSFLFFLFGFVLFNKDLRLSCIVAAVLDTLFFPFIISILFRCFGVESFLPFFPSSFFAFIVSLLWCSSILNLLLVRRNAPRAVNHKPKCTKLV
jgi:hypothetical protein